MAEFIYYIDYYIYGLLAGLLILTILYCRGQRKSTEKMMKWMDQSNDRVLADAEKLIHFTREAHIADFMVWFRKQDFIDMGEGQYRHKDDLQKIITLQQIIKLYIEETKHLWTSKQ